MNPNTPNKSEGPAMSGNPVPKRTPTARHTYALLAILPLLLTTVLTAIPVKADPPGSPPPWGWYTYNKTDVDSDSFAIGGITNVTIAIDLSVDPGNGWGDLTDIVYINLERSRIAYAYLALAIAVFFDGATHEIVGFAGDVAKKTVSYDGIFCDHIIMRTYYSESPLMIETVMVGGYLFIHIYKIAEGEYIYKKTGIFCSDTEIPFSLHVFEEIYISTDML